jgi:intracellular septation protein A
VETVAVDTTVAVATVVEIVAVATEVEIVAEVTVAETVVDMAVALVVTAEVIVNSSYHIKKKSHIVRLFFCLLFNSFHKQNRFIRSY